MKKFLTSIRAALVLILTVTLGIAATAPATASLPPTVPDSTAAIVEPDGKVHAVAVDPIDGSVYVGGDFDAAGPRGGPMVTRHNIMKLHADGSLDSSWNADVNYAVKSLAVAGGTVYAGGNFTTVNGGATNRSHAAAFDTTSALATGWNPDLNEDPRTEVNAIVVSGSTVYIAGDFMTLQATTTPVMRVGVAATNAATGIATAWDPGLGSKARAIVVDGSTIYLGGTFTQVNFGTTMVTRNRLAAFNATTGAVTPWNPNIDGPVLALAKVGTTIYAGGDFDDVNGGTARRNSAAFGPDGSATSFNPGTEGTVRSIAVTDSAVFLGGDHTVGTGSGLLAAYQLEGTGRFAWDPPATNNSINSIAMLGVSLYVGGVFSEVGGAPIRGYEQFRYFERPVSTGAPTITGTAAVGETLSVNTGTWTGSPTSYTYQWRRCDRSGSLCGDPVSGQISNTYLLTTADRNHRLVADVRAINAGGTSEARRSFPSELLEVPRPVNVVAPVLTGEARVGMLLSTTPGTWTGDDISGYTYSWMKCRRVGESESCDSLHSITNTYRVRPEDVGYTITAIVTASNLGGIQASQSNRSSTVAALEVPAGSAGVYDIIGDVRVRVDGTLVALESGIALRLPASLVVPRNAVAILAVPDGRGGLRRIHVSEGSFEVSTSGDVTPRGDLESRATSKKKYTKLTLQGGSFARCSRDAGLKTTIRKLHTQAGKGVYTVGRRSQATAKGTAEWKTIDQCRGTQTVVISGKVRVTNLRSGKTVTLKAGQKHLARAAR